MYQQSIISACPGGAQCNKRGFPKGSQIHAETGFFLNVKNPNGGFDIARLSNIPHGNSVLLLGHSSKQKNPGNNFFPVASTIPVRIDDKPIHALGYTDPITRQPQFPGIFSQEDPNTFLKAALGNQVITEMTTLIMKSNNKDAGGGILNIPFIGTNVDATAMDAIFWIETIKGKSKLQLQYTQTINLVFPPAGTADPVMWPHITVNTLTKVE
jgi:hypothetical protein